MGRVHFLIVGSHPGLDSEQEDFQIPLLLKPVGDRSGGPGIEVSTDTLFAAVGMGALTACISEAEPICLPAKTSATLPGRDQIRRCVFTAQFRENALAIRVFTCLRRD